MRKIIGDGICCALHTDRAGSEWIIVSSVDRMDKAEITEADDPLLFRYFKDLMEEE